MEWPLAKSMNAGEEIANADHPRIRLFNVGKASLDQPPGDVNGQWVICEPGTAAGFSAVGYFFGRELHDKLGVPVGLIANAWGGSSAEAWMSRKSLLNDPEFAYMVEGLGARRDALDKYHEAVREWELAGPDAEAPKWPREVRQFKWVTVLHDRMLLPLVPYELRGVIWYQGEENAPRAEQYRRLFPAVIEHWRGLWDRDDLPFLFVQLTAFRQRAQEPGDSTWAELREAQAMALSMPHTAMAVTIDIGEADNIHPKNKHDVGHRLALAALAKVYGQDVEYSGPVLDSATVQGNAIHLKMSHTGGGLATSDGQSPKGFAIAPTDGPYVRANARIEGDTVIVWSDQIEKPATVRYGWADNPQATLVNSYGLPASPFRTDDRPGVTAGKQ
jgi:sialate O-acetylesterase